MPRVIRRISTTIYGLGIVAALSFGASQALGRPAYLTCRDDGGTHLGACINNDSIECTARCNAANPWDGGEAVGRCRFPPGCCTCYL